MEINKRISQANGRLRSANVGVAIELHGQRLYLRGTLPPKPDEPGKTEFHQQRLALGRLGVRANPIGVKQAEAEARKVSALLACKEFSWQPYLRQHTEPSQTVADWVTRFETDYFSGRDRNPQSQTTWDKDYRDSFKKLPATAELTLELLRATILTTPPDTKTRKRVCMAYKALARLAGLELITKQLQGSYSPRRVQPRDIPTDRTIAEYYHQIPSPSWRWAYGMQAVYGLRNHELFHLDFSRFPILTVLDSTKTKYRMVWAIYPEWLEEWELEKVDIPEVTGRNNTILGSRVTEAFDRYSIPFNPYDLRHAWAVRSLEFGLDVSLAAAQMGHSVQVHTNLYHHWISEEIHQRAYDLLMARGDRPKAPICNPQ